jgi:tetratricopeptide (TPR) repeat protein
VGSSPRSVSSFLIKSCIVLLFYLPVFDATAAAQVADTLYADRANLASARKAADLWTEALKQNPRDFAAAWKLARAEYWIGGHVPATESRAIYENGIAAGRTAVGIEPNRPEGHFWIAANMGAMAESFGVRQGIKYRGPIKEELETVLRLDPVFQEGSADRAIGRWYQKVPRLFGGSKKDAEAHLRKSLTYNPHSSSSHFFLAELLIDDGRKTEARAELQAVLDAPVDPEWAPEDREFKEKASAMIARVR